MWSMLPEYGSIPKYEKHPMCNEVHPKSWTQPLGYTSIWTALLAYLLLRLIGWLAGWRQSFRRLFTLIKGMIWSRRNLVLLIEFMDKDMGMNGKSPPVRLTAVKLQFDFGDL